MQSKSYVFEIKRHDSGINKYKCVAYANNLTYHIGLTTFCDTYVIGFGKTVEQAFNDARKDLQTKIKAFEDNKKDGPVPVIRVVLRDDVLEEV
jgi:hypothetical protein